MVRNLHHFSDYHNYIFPGFALNRTDMSRNTYEFLRFALPFGLIGVTVGVMTGGIGGALVGGVAGAITQAYTGSPVMLQYAYIGSGISATTFGVVGLVVGVCVMYNTTKVKTGF